MSETEYKQMLRESKQLVILASVLTLGALMLLGYVSIIMERSYVQL